MPTGLKISHNCRICCSCAFRTVIRVDSTNQSSSTAVGIPALRVEGIHARDCKSGLVAKPWPPLISSAEAKRKRIPLA